MADETILTGGGENHLAAAVANLKGGKIAGTTTEEPVVEETKSSEEATETPKATEETKEDGTQSQVQSQSEESQDEVQGEPKEENRESEKILEGLENLKKLPENEGKSEEELRTILKENAERSLNPESAKEETATKNVVSPNLDEEIRSKTNGQFESLDALIEKVNSNEEANFANDQIKHLNELASKGVDIGQVLAFTNLGVDNLDPTNLSQAKKLLELELKLQEPDITDKEVDYELKRLYDLTEKYDEMDEVTNSEEIELTKLKMQRAAKKAKTTLLDKQKELELPPANKAAIEQSEAQKAEAERQVQEWHSKVDTSLASFEALDIPVGKDVSFKYNIVGESKEKLRETMQNPDKFLSRYVVDGQADIDKFRRDMTILDNWDTMSRALYNQGDSAGAERVLNSITNPSTDSTGSAPQKPVTKSPAGQIADAFKGLV